MQLQKVIISGGGTGGHIYPAIAIAQALQQRIPDLQLLFVGAEGKMEMEKVPKAGYTIVGLPIRGLQRGQWKANLTFPFRLAASLWKARRILREFRPDAVIGVGGYASGAIGQVAAWNNVPIFLQEQNAFAGLTNKLLAKYARKICVAYPGMEKFFPKERIVLTGNPVRQDIQHLEGLREKAAAHFGLAADRKTVLVLGGSLGARTVNRCIQKEALRLLDGGYQLIWQTGKGYYDALRALFPPQKGLYISDFVYEMHYAYALADVVVSRAGALSVSEICVAQKPCILIPSPNVAEDHQTKNALALAEKGAALMVKDSEAEALLGDMLMQLLADEAKQAALKNSIRAFARPDAAAQIAEVIVSEIDKA
ncbi:undecaprenyldiphospho-muramoylpentapeptide beta-N-acetylglucosaminyltransferase [Rhodoflexus caldus]|uniref:undecaprenyldiphospho-muramoylpentapeptide beta-N-acetylglucosaminyltransferase n=1 Tax=Rhodoflexus caldus TaxID=2891236 RepID=UPI00202A937F|nr:undecaprenyldiphospho-muramoylpentapeptide beta-N-acetylglucosaminyltransferase [Rhodoflexus caldus]